MLLDRQQFVRPVAVHELASGKIKELDLKSRDAIVYSDGFKTGYDANKGVYTREQLEIIFNAGRDFDYSNCKSTKYSDRIEYKNQYLEQSIAKITPLSIPKSVTIEGSKIIDIQW